MAHGLGGGEAASRILFQCSLYGSNERRGKTGASGRERWYWGLLIRECGRDRGFAAERRFTGEHLVEHDSDRIEVGLRGRGVSVDLLGGEVLRGAEQLAGGGHAAGRVGDGFGNPEVGQLGRPVGGQEDVARFDVSMDEPLGMSSPECAEHLVGDGDGLGLIESSPLGQHLVEAGALDQLEDQIGPGAILADVVDGDSVRMIEAGRDSGFAFEALPGVGIGDVRAQEFDGNPPS